MHHIIYTVSNADWSVFHHHFLTVQGGGLQILKKPKNAMYFLDQSLHYIRVVSQSEPLRLGV